MWGVLYMQNKLIFKIERYNITREFGAIKYMSQTTEKLDAR